MKPRHAAALALVGWYLMASSIDYFPPGSKDVADKPMAGWYVRHSGFSDWSIVAVYDTAKECEAGLISVPERVLLLEMNGPTIPRVKLRL
jgi:hypothetical protein